MTMPGPLAGLGATIQRQSTTGQAAAAVRDAILSGRIPPGTPLREAALTAELGVSRNTIREAARILESEGLVRYQMNRGIVVTEISADDVRDIYAARAAAEIAGADALTTHRDPAIYHKLAELVDRIEEAFARGDVAGVLEGDRLFHATLVTAAGSPRLSRYHIQLQQEQRLALTLAERSSHQLGRTTDDHRELLGALRGNPDQARAQLATHLQAGAAELRRLRDLLAQRKESHAANAR
jgi:DNA-binding GntR family transcriptional regulator